MFPIEVGRITANGNIEYYVQVGKNIFAKEEIVNEVQISLRILDSKKIGCKLLQRLGNSKHNIYIELGHKFKEKAVFGSKARTRGVGSDSVVTIVTRDMAIKNKKIFFISFAHELIHAYHSVYGKNRTREKSICDYMWTNDEEYTTIEGRPSKKLHKLRSNHQKISENAIREEHRLPKRISGHYHPESRLSKIPLMYRVSSVGLRALWESSLVFSNWSRTRSETYWLHRNVANITC